jgi:hypothetical protein
LQKYRLVRFLSGTAVIIADAYFFAPSGPLRNSQEELDYVKQNQAIKSYLLLLDCLFDV